MQNISSNQTIHYTGRKQLLKGQTKIKLDWFVLSSKPSKRILATLTILVSRVSSAYMAVPQGQVFLININTMKLYSITNENKHIIFHSFVLGSSHFDIDQKNLQVTNDADTFFQ